MTLPIVNRPWKLGENPNQIFTEDGVFVLEIDEARLAEFPVYVERREQEKSIAEHIVDVHNTWWEIGEYSDE